MMKENNRVRDDLKYVSLTHERKCSQCGKKFYTQCTIHEYVYKRESRVFCKWSCMREWDRKNEYKRIETRGRKPKKEAAVL